MIGGKPHYPQMYGDEGWYHYTPEPYNHGALELYYLSHARRRPLRRARQCLARLPRWRIAELSRRGPAAGPRQTFAAWSKAFRMTPARPTRAWPTTRCASILAACDSLVELAMGGLIGGKNRLVLHSRLRYFDADHRRAGLPDGVAALIEKMTADSVTLSLVNVDQVHSRTVVIQAGGYGEHQFREATIGDRALPINASHLSLRLAAGSGTKLQLKLQRYANQPTWAFPWDR